MCNERTRTRVFFSLCFFSDQKKNKRNSVGTQRHTLSPPRSHTDQYVQHVSHGSQWDLWSHPRHVSLTHVHWLTDCSEYVTDRIFTHTRHWRLSQLIHLQLVCHWSQGEPISHIMFSRTQPMFCMIHTIDSVAECKTLIAKNNFLLICTWLQRVCFLTFVSESCNIQTYCAQRVGHWESLRVEFHSPWFPRSVCVTMNPLVQH